MFWTKRIKQPTRKHVILLGDSVFDNNIYITSGNSVMKHLAEITPEHVTFTLIAKDNTKTSAMQEQLRNIPNDATHLIVSCGGNDALANTDIFQLQCKNVAEALALVEQRIRIFDVDHARMILWLAKFNLPTTLCTIYDADFPYPDNIVVKSALRMFNEIIMTNSILANMPVLDLRNIFTESRDFVNTWEPSRVGGQKLAESLVRIYAAPDSQ